MFDADVLARTGRVIDPHIAAVVHTLASWRCAAR